MVVSSCLAGRKPRYGSGKKRTHPTAGLARFSGQLRSRGSIELPENARLKASGASKQHGGRADRGVAIRPAVLI